MNPGPYVKSLVPALLAVLYSLHSWVVTGHLDALHVRESLFGLAIAAVVYWLPNTPAEPEPAPTEPQTIRLGPPSSFASGGFTAPAGTGGTSIGPSGPPPSPPGTTLRAVQ